ncbi:hypothetical protein M3Y94_00220200 [Aphelenchoides besseyi]|nr:hypothetical protein M3Y94_00220200 [Aphelenchoides besseyi]KAI6236538.1 39S ribosomal protein L15, mitochondrial [Aphelenchoides besseyi]
MASKAVQQASKGVVKKIELSQVERATKYIEEASRVRLQDIKDNPGARVGGRLVRAGKHNQGGHTIGELQRAAKPPLGWLWGDFFRPWHRMFPGDKHFNGDINLRREYVPLSLVELQRLIDLNWLKTDQLIDLTQLCNTQLVKVKSEWRQFGVHLTDEGSDIFTTPINLEVQWASQTAIAAVERAGGRIRLAYYDIESVGMLANPRAYFEKGIPVPRRKRPPHSLISFYSNPKNRGYLAEESECEKAADELAQILDYKRTQSIPSHVQEEKHPDHIFLGIEPGSLVSLADKKIFRPTHPVHRDFYCDSEPLAEHMR